MIFAGPDRLFDAGRLSGDQTEDIPVVLLSVLVGFNFVLLVFNLVPAFPLDGGRIARAAAWRMTGDRGKSTRFAARLGQAFGGPAGRLRPLRRCSAATPGACGG